MAIVQISRDTLTQTVDLVRLISTDALGVVDASGYLTAQVANLSALNKGVWQWLGTDEVLVEYGAVVNADGSITPGTNAFFQVSADLTTLIATGAAGTVTQSGSAVIGHFASFASTGGSIEDLGYLPTNPALTEVVMQSGGATTGDIPKYHDASGTLIDSGITAAAITALIASSGGGSTGGLGVHSATFSGTGSTASTVINDPAISATSVVLARFISSANVVTTQTVLPAAGTVTVVTDTAPSTSVIEYISFTPSAALLSAGVVVGKGSYGGGSATFVIADANVTASMVVNANFESQVTPSRIYTVTAGAGTLTFVCSANPGVCVIEYAAMLPGTISPLGLEAVNHTYAGGFASIVISDAAITANSIVSADFKSQSNVALIQKVTPSAGTLTVLASIDPGPSVVAYISTPTAVGGNNGNLAIFSGTGALLTQNAPALNTIALASATPGTVRSLVGSAGNSILMTSGNLVGLRGVVNTVGASGGFLYGTQGKVIDTGTLSGSSWTAGLFGQLDISAATVNAGQMAPIWGDYGSTSGTLTDRTGMYGIAMTNTTAAVLASQLYLYGGATVLMSLQTNVGGVGATYVATPTGATPSGALRTLAVNIDGTVYHILAAAVYSS